MKQLLIRADDLGISYAVDLGIARSVTRVSCAPWVS